MMRRLQANLGLACALELAMSTSGSRGAPTWNPHLERLERADVPQAERIYRYLVDNPSPLGLSVGHQIDQLIQAVERQRVQQGITDPCVECAELRHLPHNPWRVQKVDPNVERVLVSLELDSRQVEANYLRLLVREELPKILPPPDSTYVEPRRHGKGAQRRRSAPWASRRR